MMTDAPTTTTILPTSWTTQGSGLTQGSAQVPQDGIRLVQGEVSILKFRELPIQLGEGEKLGEAAVSQQQPS